MLRSCRAQHSTSKSCRPLRFWIDWQRPEPSYTSRSLELGCGLAVFDFLLQLQGGPWIAQSDPVIVGKTGLGDSPAPVALFEVADMEKVGGTDLVPKRPGARTLLTVSGRRIGLVRTADGNLHALDAICYHMGGPLVASGDLEEIGTRQCLKCPWHKYLLDIRTGEGLYRDLDFKWSSKGVGAQPLNVSSKGGLLKWM